MTIQLVLAKRHELPLIHQINQLSFEALFNKYQDNETSPYTETLAVLAEKFERKGNQFYIIKENEKTIGFVRCVISESGTELRIAPIAIVPECENKGSGRKAMILVEKLFPLVEKFRLDTILQEEKLTRFYESLGYEREGISERIKPDMDIVYYIKKHR